MKPLGSPFLLVNALSVHSDTHLSRCTAQPFLIPSAFAVHTNCPRDLIVIEYGK